MFELAKAFVRQLEHHDHTHIDLAKSCWVVEMVLLDFTNLLAPCLVGQVSCWDEKGSDLGQAHQVSGSDVPDFGPDYEPCTRTRVQTKGRKQRNMRHPSGKGVSSHTTALGLIHG